MLTHLHRLEPNDTQILSEVVAECKRPLMLYSIGKDSASIPHLARKAFHPGPLPIPLLHIDTTWRFRDMYAVHSKRCAERLLAKVRRGDLPNFTGIDSPY